MSSTKSASAIVAFAIYGAFVAAAPADDPQYALTELGILEGPVSVAERINDQGWACGLARKDKDGNPVLVHAVRWVNDVITDLGDLGYRESEAFDINNLGQVVGRAPGKTGYYRAFLWLPEAAYGLPAGINDLGALGGGNEDARAYGLNDDGEIAGESRPKGNTSPRPVRWWYAEDAWHIADLGDLGGPYGRAAAINAKGQITGQANDKSGNLRAFIWLPADDYGLSAGIHSLGTKSGYSFGLGINNKGQVVGVENFQAFLWLPEDDYGLKAGKHLLGTLPGGADSYAYDINERGQIVGEAAIVASKKWKAFLWQSGEMTLLEDHLLPEGDGYRLVRAKGINPAGQIVGTCVKDDRTRALLLTPVECAGFSTGDANCDGSVDFNDIDAFVLALTDPTAYAAEHPGCNWHCAADANRDGAVDFDDIDPFVALLTGK